MVVLAEGWKKSDTLTVLLSDISGKVAFDCTAPKQTMIFFSSEVLLKKTQLDYSPRLA